MQYTVSLQDFSNVTEDKNLQVSGSPFKKIKPWVYRPKKVMYSLEESQPARKQFSTSHWNQQENKKYIEFLIKFKTVLEGPKKNRRKWHLNRIMSKEVSTRSHQQCRSHHQKMMKHYRSVDGILNHLQKEMTESTPSIQVDETSMIQKQENKNAYDIEDLQKFWNFDQMDYSVGIQLPFFQNQESSNDFI